MVGKKIDRPPSENAIPKMEAKLKDEDMISRLPDEVIGIILSLLTFREATRTCLLCHRWKTLWYLYNGSFVFDFITCAYTGNVEHRERERSKYIDWVNKVLTRIEGNNHSIKEFILSAYSDQVSKSHLDTWVAFAFKRKVQKLELDMRPYFCRGTKDEVPFTFPVELFRSGLYNTSSLTSIRLKDVHFSGEILEYFLSICPRLEHLCVHNSNHLINLKVIGAAATFPLKYLEIDCCTKMEYLEVSAPNLVSFQYFGQNINLQLEKSPKLLEVALSRKDTMNSLLRFSSYFTQIESLKLAFFDVFFNVEEHKQFMQRLNFPRLKHLTLSVLMTGDDILLGWTTLIGCCPLLHKFTLEMLRVGVNQRMAQAIRRRVHENLKVVEVLGFRGCPTDMEFLMHLFRTSPALEKIILNWCEPHVIGYGCWKSQNLTSAANKAVSCLGAQRLERKLPPYIELVHIE